MDSGARLREARLAHGLSLDTLAKATRIAPQKLAAIERNDVSVFPPGPYVHGFVRAYAAEVGLAPDDTARAYLAQFTAVSPPTEPRAPERIGREPILPDVAGGNSWKTSAVAGAALLAFVVTWAAWPDAQRSGRDVPTGEPGALGTAGPGGAPADVRADPRPVASAPGSAAASAPLTVTLEAEDPSWVSATADGERVIFRTLQPGDREVVRATREIVLRVGDAGALRWSRGNGASESMGSRGAVRTIRLTPDGPR
jgi:cytoskeletal protein RodZ